ncbi:MAG TPA: [protein-PII] uridylyltransferase [Actinomycetota bacterium]|nr:[protein-PII] uridylyltransferase [Actinomycetota bacterium]
MPTLSEIRRAQSLRIEDGIAPAVLRAQNVDSALSDMVAETLGPTDGLAVAAVGGYGRGELSPHSDIDLLFLSARRDITPASLRGLLYPLWDAGFQIGHALRSPKQAVEHAKDDLDAATALLHARFIAGDEATFAAFVDRRATWIRKDTRRIVRRILDSTAERHAARDRAGWSLAPNLKEDVGALRDFHTLLWLEEICDRGFQSARASEAAAVLSAVREALHAKGKRKNDYLRIDAQPTVAERLGVDLDELMTALHSAARTIEYVSMVGREEAVHHVFGGPRRSGAARPLRPHVFLEDGELTVRPGARPLDVLAAYSHTGRRPSLRALDLLEQSFDSSQVARWDATLRSTFLDLLGGRHADSALELLDQVDGIVALVPEWRAVRGRAQHDPYHRYTVDGHTFRAVAEVNRVLEDDPVVAAAGAEIGSLDALRIGALLHDIGKGSGTDHSIAGAETARVVTERMGLSPSDADDVVMLVRHHLLIPDTATRRDLDDGAVIETVARIAATSRRLKMLYVLAVADGSATGPRAWNDWKAALVRELYAKALAALETGDLPVRSDVATRAQEIEAYEPGFRGRAADLLGRMPPSYLDSVSVPEMVEELRLISNRPPRPGEVIHRVEQDGDRALVTVCVSDRPGALARSAGAFTLSQVSILRAQAYATSEAVALQRFVVEPPASHDWAVAFAQTLGAAYGGRLALEHDVERKIAVYRSGPPVRPAVRILQDASQDSTVIEVRAHDTIGLLYATTAAISDLGLDIRIAKIATVGERVVDVFYVRGPDGDKLDPEQTHAVERAILHRIARLFP